MAEILSTLPSACAGQSSHQLMLWLASKPRCPQPHHMLCKSSAGGAVQVAVYSPSLRYPGEVTRIATECLTTATANSESEAQRSPQGTQVHGCHSIISARACLYESPDTHDYTVTTSTLSQETTITQYSSVIMNYSNCKGTW